MKPEPTPVGRSLSPPPGLGCWRRWELSGRGTPKNLRSSSSICCSALPPCTPRATWVFSMVRMLTTEGPTLSTRGVKSGSPLTRGREGGADAGGTAAREEVCDSPSGREAAEVLALQADSTSARVVSATVAPRWQRRVRRERAAASAARSGTGIVKPHQRMNG